jgi:hypothetical protein
MLGWGVCLILFGFAAYKLAGHLFDDSMPDRLGLAIILFIASATLAMIVPGFLGMLNPISVFGASCVISGVMIVMRPKPFPRLPSPPSENLNKPMRLLWWGAVIACVLLIIVTIVSYIWKIHLYEFVNNDIVWTYFPTMMRFLQQQTLWYTLPRMNLLSYNYDLFMSSGMLYTSDLSPLAALHLLAGVGCVVYTLNLLRLVLSPLSIQRQQLASFFVVIFMLVSSSFLEIFFNVGSNDLLVALMTLAAVYYFVRYWDAPDERYMLLIGLASAVMVGAKWISLGWCGGIGLVQLVLLWRAKRVNVGLVFRQLVYAGLPFIPFVLPWGIRALTMPTTAGEKLLSQQGWDRRIVNLYDLPTITAAQPLWLPLLGFMIVGIILVAFPSRRWVRLCGVGVLWIAIGAIFVENFSKLIMGNFYIMMAVFLFVALIRRWKPNLISKNLQTVAILGIIFLVLFAFLPFSIWTENEFFDGTAPTVVGFRYVPSIVPLTFIVITAFFMSVFPFQPSNTTHVPNPKLRHAAAILFAMLCVGIPLFRAAVYQPRDTWTQFDNWENQYAEPTPLFSWIRQNLHDTSIYVVNLPTTPFYGAALNNRVWAAEYYESLASGWRLSDVQPFINEQQIAYFAIGFPYNGELMIARSVPDSPDIQMDIAQMRRDWRVAFADEQGNIIFATPYAQDNPLTETRYEFDTLAGNWLYGLGWTPPQSGENCSSFRQLRGEAGRIVIYLSSEQDLNLQIRICGLNAANAVIDFKVNGTPLQWITTNEDGSGILFTATIPAQLISQNVNTMIEFRASQTTPFDWLSIAP